VLKAIFILVSLNRFVISFFVEGYEHEPISFYYFGLLHFYSSVGLSYCIICFVDGCRFGTDSYVVYIFCLISPSLFSDTLDVFGQSYS
jgi:hypothetical protein